jgi:hypothetical protein
VRGWSSSLVVTAFVGGANMMMTGIMGLYVGRIYAEVKGRPLYVIDRAVGFEADAEDVRKPLGGARDSRASAPSAGRRRPAQSAADEC